MAVSSSSLVQRVRDLVHDNPYETTSTTTTTSTTVAVVDGTRWDEGDAGEWQTGTVGYEQFRVASVSSNNLTVTRGYNGTTAETHTSGDRVIKNPLFTGRQIQQAIAAVINELWPRVYITGTVSLTPVTGQLWYDLDAETLDIIKVGQLYGASSERFGRFGIKGTHPYAYDGNLPAALVASGKGIRFPAGLFSPSNTVTVTDKRAITGTSDIEDSGQLPVADAVVYGAVGRLLQALETKRVASGEVVDIANSVGTGARLQTGAWYEAEYKTKKEDLAQRLSVLNDADTRWR